jgi:protein SCO1
MIMPRLRRCALLLVIPGLLLAGCRRKAPAADASSPRYALKGRVVAVDPERREVTIAHEDIPGFMPAMTMPYIVRGPDALLLRSLSPGDEVTAQLVVPDSRYWIEDLVVVKKGTPSSAAHTVVRPLPKPGDPLPDVALVNQDGGRIRLADYRGRAIALTFVYTRCPLLDFCPLMMKNFGAVHAALLTDARLREKTHLLTVSFDPAHDTPAILRAYGMPFQKTKPPFTQWELATGSLEAIRTLGEALDLDYVEEEHTFTHNLRTAVVDPEGRLFRLHTGNDWTPVQLVRELREATGG